MRIDAHQHFWKYDPVRDDWITEEIKILKNDFLPANLQPLLEKSKMDGCVLVQSDQTLDGNSFLIEQAKKNSFIKAVVGWVDLQSPNLEKQLTELKQFAIVKGFRHILQSEPDRKMMLRPSFLKGIYSLGKYNFSFDILIFKEQLKYIPEFLKDFPNQLFVLDHLGKPDIRNHKIGDWKKEILRVAKFPNLFCKISGMFAEADYQHWRHEDFRPYLDVLVENFGTERLMYGSDWPVCLVAAEYDQQLQVVEDYFSSFSKDEQEKIFGENAKRFYGIK